MSVASSADTGIVGDIDNKVIFIIFKKTPKFEFVYYVLLDIFRKILTTNNFQDHPQGQAN